VVRTQVDFPDLPPALALDKLRMFAGTVVAA
jgi:hypothetical protein